MRDGEPSRTAVMTCMGRALADRAFDAARFSDPTALALLPQRARSEVERIRAGAPPKDLRARMQEVHLAMLAKLMVVRTLAIDEVIRAAAAPQLVILGAGLDGRAWRLPELAAVTVFEVDHPDSQRDKRARLGGMRQSAGEVRFVPVDFSRDDLDAALDGAGHDAGEPTTWVWEGVVMYLRAAEIEATLATIRRRSRAGSRLVILYQSPAWLARMTGLITRRLGEPLRSAFTADTMRTLLDRHNFAIVQDETIPALAACLSGELARALRPLAHFRLVTAQARHESPAAVSERER